MAIDPTPRANEFRVAASYRRGAWKLLFVLMGIFLAGQADAWLWDADRASLGKTVLGFSILVGPGVILVLFALRWRLRVDEAGVGRRRLLGWEIWPWDAFEGGQVRPIEGMVDGYCWQGPRGGCRRLGSELDLMDRSERELLHQVIRGHWAPPSDPEPPGELVIRYDGRKWRREPSRGPLRREARFAPEGIWLGQRGDLRWYPWRDVQSLWIERFEHGRRDFRRLELTLVDETAIRFHLCKESPARNWSGASGEEIAGVLLRRVHPGRSRVVATAGPPESREEARERLGDVERRIADLDSSWPKFELFIKILLTFIISIFLAIIGLQLSLVAWAGETPRSHVPLPMALMFIAWGQGLLAMVRVGGREARECLVAERLMLVERARTPVCAAG